VVGVAIPITVDVFRWPNCYAPDDDDAATYAEIMRHIDEAEMFVGLSDKPAARNFPRSSVRPTDIVGRTDDNGAFFLLY
jgi:hypothetical protein